jgi:copper chaperone CopZ
MIRMKTLFISFLLVLAVSAHAQLTRVSLQASGLTCSMCSKAVNSALQKVPFVEKVQVNIKNQEYNLSFKEGTTVDLDALQNAVEDAGFSVARLNVTANFENQKIGKDEHIKLGDQYFHFLNGAGKQLSGSGTFTVVDKKFTSAKDYKKYSSLSKMECVQTGKMSKCCAKEDIPENTRVYHVII